MTYKRIAVDTSKAVFTLHGIDETDRPTLRRDLNRSRFEAFVASTPATEFALEASSASHHWGRLLEAHGHRVKLIPPQYVRPFVKRSKNDRTDAAAICEAAGRPGMSTVPVRSLERQAQSTVMRTRERLVKQHTELVNAARGHAAEFGIIAARGTAHLAALLERVQADPTIPDRARREIGRLVRTANGMQAEIDEIDRELASAAKEHDVARRLMEVPGSA